MIRGERKSLRITLEATETGVLGYVYLREITAGEVARTVEVEPSVMVDYDSGGRLVGIEFLNARSADTELTHRLAKELEVPELAGLDLAEICKTPT